ncbi:MAG TPA: VCBS repeat-containing protein, partial [Gemmata sp.]|nr:VCBS repeat-containing protein [Gemmata sp.]
MGAFTPHGWLNGRRLTVLVGVVLIALSCAIGYWAGTTTRRAPEEEMKSDPLLSGSPWFRDVTSESGLKFTYRNGEEAKQFTILESLGGGVALIDYDGDGRLDIFVTGGGYFERGNPLQIVGLPCKLYRNLGNFKFEDVTEKVGLDKLPLWYTHGVAVADYDCDGWPDLLVTGYGRLILLHNE